MKLLDYLAPSMWKDLVIYTSGDSYVRALDKDTGDLVWEKDFSTYTTSAPTVAGDYLYFGIAGENYPGGDQPKLICLSARNGKTMWELEIEGKVLSAPVIAQDWIIFGTDEYYFYVLESLF
jgi:hypothetical protein